MNFYAIWAIINAVIAGVLASVVGPSSAIPNFGIGVVFAILSLRNY